MIGAMSFENVTRCADPGSIITTHEATASTLFRLRPDILNTLFSLFKKRRLSFQETALVYDN
jgi:hypothetical protein